MSAVGCRDESARHTENGSSSPKPRSHPPIRRLHAKPTTCIISDTDNCVISCSAWCNPWSCYIVISLLFDTDKKIKLLITAAFLQLHLQATLQPTSSPAPSFHADPNFVAMDTCNSKVLLLLSLPQPLHDDTTKYKLLHK